MLFTFSHGFELLSSYFFIWPKGLPVEFLVGRTIHNKLPLTLLIWQHLDFLSSLKDSLLDIEFFYFQHLKYVISLPPVALVSDEKSQLLILLGTVLPQDSLLLLSRSLCLSTTV